jgi:uncharacterized protein (TIGR02246 family)
MSARSPEETHALIAAALNDRDLEAFVEIYEEEATLIVPPDGQRVTGRDAIRAAVAPTFELAPSARIEVLEKLQADGLALTQAHWSIVGTDGGERVEMSGNGAIVSRRQADGSWRIVLDNPMGPKEDR